MIFNYFEKEKRVIVVNFSASLPTPTMESTVNNRSCDLVNEKCDMPKAKTRNYDDREKKNQMKTLKFTAYCLLLTLLKFKSLSVSC